MWKFIKLLKSFFFILFLFNSFFSWLTDFIQITWYDWSSLMIFQNILFFTWAFVIRIFIHIDNLFFILLKGFSHNMILLESYMFDHSFKMELILWNVLLSFQFLLNLSFSDFIIKLSDDFCLHVLFLLFLWKASPI